MQNSLWFDLSPQNIAGKLGSGKSDVARLVHMVFTVAKAAAPAVVYMDEVDKMFSSSKKKSGVEEVTRLKKQIVSYRDGIGKEDRILFIGNSSRPFDDAVEQGELKSFFNPRLDGKMFYLPYPDYASRSKLWRTFISRAVSQMIGSNDSTTN
jgi:ATP-dependent 26S proteasome regulatory subunit